MRYIPKQKIRTDACEYLGISEGELDDRIKVCREKRAQYWDEVNPSSPKQLDEYYANGEMLIENLVDFNTTFGYEVHFPDPALFGQKILDFGCGMAYTGHAMYTENKDVTIADIPNQAFSFAKARFINTGVKTIDLVGGTLPFKGSDETFDAIFCIDVIEHIVNPIEMIWHFYEHMNKNGKLYITNLNAKPDNVHKQHLIHQPPQIEAMMQLMGWKHNGGPVWVKI